MRKAVIALALVGCVSPSYSPTEELLNERHSSLVETAYGTGTGFPVSDDAFLTAWHVVDGVEPEGITVDGWVVLEVIRLGELDAAMLVTGLHGQEPWPLAARGPRPGERVWKSGYGQGLHWWTEGIGTDDVNRVAIDVFPGDSGGPVFNARGEVVGMIVALGVIRAHGWTQDHILHHCWVIPAHRLLEMMPEFEHEPVQPPAPLPVQESAWERFLRLREERLGY